MEALAITAGIVGLVATAGIFLRGGLMVGCLAVLAAGTCLSVPFYKTNGAVPLTVDRLLLVLLVAQCFIWRRLGMADRKPAGKPESLLAALLVVLTISTFAHDWQINNDQPVVWLVLYYIMPAALYWVARRINYSERTVRVLLGGLSLLGVYLAVTSLAEYFHVWWLVWPSYIATSAADKTVEFVGRARGPLLNPIANGILLAACFGAALMWWPWLRARAWNRDPQADPLAMGAWPERRLASPDCGRGADGGTERVYALSFRQLGLVAITLLFLAAFYCSLTRSVWMGGVLALAFAVGLALPWRSRLLLLGAGLTLSLLLTATHWDELLAFKRDQALGADKTAESVELRPILAKIAWDMFLDRPLFGCGYYQYKSEHLKYLSDRSTGLALERGREFIPHNVALSLLTETGLLGLGLFAALLFLWSRDAWRLWSNTAIPLWARQTGLLFLIALGAYLINGMFHDVSVMPMANMTLFFLAGVSAGLREIEAARADLIRPGVAGLDAPRGGC